MSTSPYCQACRREAPTRYVEFYQNIGLLLMRYQRSIRGNLCKSCISKHFWELTGLTLVTGWWGLVSFVVNWFFLINNIVRYCGTLGMPAEHAEEDYRD